VRGWLRFRNDDRDVPWAANRKTTRFNGSARVHRACDWHETCDSALPASMGIVDRLI